MKSAEQWDAELTNEAPPMNTALHRIAIIERIQADAIASAANKAAYRKRKWILLWRATNGKDSMVRGMADGAVRIETAIRSLLPTRSSLRQ